MSTADVCGLDIGLSTTDAVAGWSPQTSLSVSSVGDPGAGEAVLEELLRLAPRRSDRELVVAATGVGAHRLGSRLGEARVERVEEFRAIARGAMRLCGRREALVASLGTGTALVSVREAEVRHVVPGTGIGGGTLVGLGRLLVGTSDAREIARLAASGNRRVLDVTIGEAFGGALGALPADATAANFAKLSQSASAPDLAASLVNLVVEAALTATLLAMQATEHRVAVFVGKLPLLGPVAQRILEVSTALGGRLEISPRPDLATALGALWTIEESCQIE